MAGKETTFGELEIGTMFKRSVGPESVAMLCTKVSQTRASHRLGFTDFAADVPVVREGPRLCQWQDLEVGDVFYFSVNDAPGGVRFTKISGNSAEAESWLGGMINTATGSTVRVDATHRPVYFVRSMLK